MPARIQDAYSAIEWRRPLRPARGYLLLDMDMYAGDGCGRELAYDQFLQLVADQLRDAQGGGAALLGDCAIWERYLDQPLIDWGRVLDDRLANASQRRWPSLWFSL